MKFPIKREISLSQSKAVFYVSYLDIVYFDGQLLTHLPDGVNLDKLAQMMEKDEKLNELVQKYNKLTELSKEWDNRISLLEDLITDALAQTEIYPRTQLTSKDNCGVKKDKKYSGVDYYTDNFWLETTSTKYNYGCLVKEIAEAVKQIDPITRVHVIQMKDLIAIHIDGSLVYMTNRFTLRAVLSLFKHLIKTGKLNEFLDTLHELKELHDKKAEKVGVFFDIARRIQELAEKLKE